MLDYLRFKEIGELYARGNAAQARQLLMEVQSRWIALRDELTMLQARLQNMEETLRISHDLIAQHGFYWLKRDGLRLGPFCPRCYDGDGALIRLEKCGAGHGCPYCGELFRKPEPVAPAPAQHARIFYFVR